MEDFSPHAWNRSIWLNSVERRLLGLGVTQMSLPCQQKWLFGVFCVSDFPLFENSVMTLQGADVLKGNGRPFKEKSQRHFMTIISINKAKSQCASASQVYPGMGGQTVYTATVMQRFVNGETWHDPCIWHGCGRWSEGWKRLHCHSEPMEASQGFNVLIVMAEVGSDSLLVCLAETWPWRWLGFY